MPNRSVLIASFVLFSAQLVFAEDNPIEEGFSGVIVSPETKNISIETQTIGDGNTIAYETKAHPGTIAAFKVGHEDIYTYSCATFEMPRQLLDADGGTIRLILQHELDPHDQLRIIDEHIAAEWIDDTFGKRGRYAGLYGWTRQSGGGDIAWVLGDQVAHNLAAPWGWIWVDDFARFGNGQLLGGNKVQICSHPHVTARIFLRD
ncbi:hypothetical protein [Sinorhizobium meliloti]|uniref:hypothetical protein n=1 Tax=Rhizobium meliloti TaxID=382 RepID=UPI001296B2D2|nr:hypothetical protein [Sinorhizobium meliloti]MQU69063.1 hypothetical protein [Sinorhizobium meliloti]